MVMANRPKRNCRADRLPMQYVLSMWRKDTIRYFGNAAAKHAGMSTEPSARDEDIANMCQTFIATARISENHYNTVRKAVLTAIQTCKIEQHLHPNPSVPSHSSDDVNAIKDPSTAKKIGRPPSVQKKSWKQMQSVKKTSSAAAQNKKKGNNLQSKPKR